MNRQIVIILHSDTVDLLHILLDTGHFLGPLQTEFHIAGLQFISIVKLYAFPQFKFVLCVIHNLKTLCQIPYRLTIIINFDQTIINMEIQRCRW